MVSFIFHTWSCEMGYHDVKLFHAISRSFPSRFHNRLMTSNIITKLCSLTHICTIPYTLNCSSKQQRSTNWLPLNTMMSLDNIRGYTVSLVALQHDVRGCIMSYCWMMCHVWSRSRFLSGYCMTLIIFGQIKYPHLTAMRHYYIVFMPWMHVIVTIVMLHFIDQS